MFRRAMEKKRSGEGGFTLVELLIVIVILGILAAIVVLAIGGLSGSASGASCNAGAKTISSAEDAYYASINPNTGVANGVYTDGNGLLTGNAGKLLKTDPANQGLQVAPTNNGAGFSITPVANGRCVGHLNPNPFTEQD